MLEWIQGFLIALGSGTVVLIGILTVCKGLVVKWFEAGIEASFAKSQERWKHEMKRSTRAYELLLEREFRFYERIEPLIAELIPLAHDLLFCLKHDETVEPTEERADIRKLFKRYCELAQTLKNEALIHQNYIPPSIFQAFVHVVTQMQDDTQDWFDMAMLFFAGEYDKIDGAKGELMVNALLHTLADAETEVKNRLRQLCGEA